MSSGKQLSFAFGEISPILHNKSDSPFFTSGLKQALNGVVRNTGGFSNRSGTVLFETGFPLPQEDIDGKTNGCRLFTYTEPIYGEQHTIVIGKTIPGSSGPTFPQPAVLPVYIYNSSGTPQSHINLAVTYTAASAGATIDLDSVDFKRIKGNLLVTFKVTALGAGFWTSYKYYLFNIIKVEPGSTPPDFAVFNAPSASVVIGAPGSPILGALNVFVQQAGITATPVAYKVYQELFDGSEFFWQQAVYGGGMPTGLVANQVQGYSLNASDKVKQYNVYRSACAVIPHPAGAPTPAGVYGLVGRIPADASVTVNGDALITPDMTITPPDDDTVYAASTVGNIKNIFFSKERYFVIPKEGLFDEGSIAASKLGSVYFFKRGLAPTELDSFVFTVDSDAREPVEIRSITEVENMLVLTSEAVYALRGSEGGVVSYANINPIAIYNEGIAKNLSPAALSNQIFYVNTDRSKIISLRASDASSESYLPDLVSQYSAHLLKKRNIKRMVVTKSADTIVWCLTADGKLISITYDENIGVKGFARHELGGFIEDISISKTTNDPLGISPDFSEKVQTLSVMIIRDETRYIETMAVRDDVDLKNFLFADAAVRFGNLYNVMNFSLRILTDTNFDAGSELTVIDDAANNLFIIGGVEALDVYLADGSYLRLVKTSYVNGNELKAICDYDIPVELQGVPVAKYLMPVKSVGGLSHLAGKEVSVYADGIVLSSPLNKATQLPVMTVNGGGTVIFDDFYQWGYVGLPYKFLAETLPLEASDNRTFTDKGKLINRVGIALEASLGGLMTQKPDAALIPENVGYLNYQRDSNMYSAQEPESKVFEEVIPAEWNMEGSVCVIQVDPLPITVAAIYPKGIIGG